MNMDRGHIESLWLLLFFVNFYALNIVIVLSYWTPSDEFFGIHRSPGNPEYPLNIIPPPLEYKTL